jgi:hypothetical protein
MPVIQWISWLALGIFGAAAIISLRSFRNNFPADLKWLSVLWVLLFLIDVGGSILKIRNVHNLWVYNIFGWLFYLPLAALYYQKIDNTIVRKCIRVFAVLFMIMIVADTLFIEGFQRLQSLVIVVGGTAITIIAAAYLRQLYQSESNEKITRDPWFWFSIAFIVYFGGSVPYLGMLNFLWEHYTDFAAVYYFYIYITFTMVMHSLIITGFLCRTNFQR